MRVSTLLSSRGFASTVLVALLLVAIAVFPAAAQITTGDISGYVRDASGASIPDATVTATMTEQQFTRTTTTNAEGFYSFLSVAPGTYEFTFQAPGFRRLLRTGVDLTANQNLRLDASLEVGTVETEITVTSAAPLVDVSEATLSGLVDDRRVVDLPLNGRNVMGLAKILPGVLNVSSPQTLNNSRGGAQMNVNGGRGNMNQVSFNAGYFTNPSRNTAMNPPPPDAVQEVSMLTHNFAAEYGRNPGSQISVVSKAGTNSFHGSVWEFLRNDNLNARSFFEPRIPAQVQNQFGAAAGGPIIKNKLFAFGSWQSLRDRREASTVQASVPSAAHRNGDFTDLSTTLKNPTDPVTGEPFTNSQGQPCVVANVISPGCISSVSSNFLSRYVPVTPSGEIVSLSARPANYDQYMFRIDWNLSDSHRVYGSWLRDDSDENRALAGGSIPDYIGEVRTNITTHVTLNDTYTFSPTVLNNFTFTYLDTPTDYSQTPTIDPSELGIDLPQYLPTGAITFDVAGNFQAFSGFTTKFFSKNYQFKDSLNWIKGRHNFKFGYEFLRLQFHQRFIGSPSYSFNGSRSGDPVADFILGAFDSFDVNFGVRDTDVSTQAHAVFFQDEYRIRPGLTLTYGIRWEPFLPWVEKDDRINTVDPCLGPLNSINDCRRSTAIPDAPPGLVFPGDVSRGLAPNDYNNWGPRLGIAWDVFGDGKTSVRAGYGMFFESINGDSLAQENAPFAGFAQSFSGRIQDPFGSVGLTPPPVELSGSFGCVGIDEFPKVRCDLFPLPVGGVLTDLGLRTPYVQSFNLSIQHQLSESVMAEVAYAGKIGIKLPALRTYNPAAFVPSPVDGAAPSDQNINERVIFEPGILSPQGYLLGNDFRSWYHSFQGQITKRFAKDWSLLGSYTLSKSIDSSSTTNLGATVSNPFDLSTERGRSSWDRRHAVAASWLWSPSVPFTSGAAKAILGGWTLTGIHSFQSGTPITFTMGDDVALDGTGGSQHAELQPGVTVDDITIDHSDRSAMIARFFNTDAFVPTNDVPRGVYGNAGRSLISGPAFFNSDFSILKDFTFHEEARLQFRAEFFNAFNQVNFSNPTASVASSSFGRIRGAQPGRQIQFGLKFLW